MTAITVSYGNKTDAEVKLVMSGDVFGWLMKENRIFDLPQPCSPAQLFRFMIDRDSHWREFLLFAGFTPTEIRELNKLGGGTNGT